MSQNWTFLTNHAPSTMSLAFACSIRNALSGKALFWVPAETGSCSGPVAPSTPTPPTTWTCCRNNPIPRSSWRRLTSLSRLWNRLQTTAIRTSPWPPPTSTATATRTTATTSCSTSQKWTTATLRPWWTLWWWMCSSHSIPSCPRFWKKSVSTMRKTRFKTHLCRRRKRL